MTEVEGDVARKEPEEITKEDAAKIQIAEVLHHYCSSHGSEADVTYLDSALWRNTWQELGFSSLAVARGQERTTSD